MTMCRAIVRVEEEFKDRIEEAVKEAYPGSSLVSLDRDEDVVYATFRIRTRETCNAVDARLHDMEGISVLSVSRPHAELPPRLRTRSFWAVTAMTVACAGFAAAAFVPDSPMEDLSQAHMLVIQTMFSLAVAIVVYIRDRDAVGYLAGCVGRVHFLAGEINERVKWMAGSRR